MKQPYIMDGSVIPVRLEQLQANNIKEFQEKTGLSRSFIIRRCINYAMDKFLNGEVDILTLGKK